VCRDLFWVLALLVEKLQLREKRLLWIIGLGRLPALPAHGISPLEEDVRRACTPMQTSRKLPAFRLACHVRGFPAFRGAAFRQADAVRNLRVDGR
jgi:hypothetical protein